MSITKNRSFENQVNDIENLIVSLILSASLYILLSSPIPSFLNFLNDYYYLIILTLFSVFWFSVALYSGKISGRVADRTATSLTPLFNPVFKKINIFHLIFISLSIFAIHYFLKFGYKEIFGTLALGFIGTQLPKIIRKSH